MSGVKVVDSVLLLLWPLSLTLVDREDGTAVCLRAVAAAKCGNCQVFDFFELFYFHIILFVSLYISFVFVCLSVCTCCLFVCLFCLFFYSHALMF